MKKRLQELKEEEIMPFKEWYSMISQPNTTVDSNKEHQQQHQDYDATIRIQSIFCGYSTQQQLHLQKISVISIQAVAHGFIALQQHKCATTIQALFQGCCSQKLLCLKCNALPDPVSQQDHVKEMLHFDDLLSNFTSDFDAITNNFQQLIELSCDINSDHDILWP
eukprot:262397-Ditylum_brightwellii.AAC.1